MNARLPFLVMTLAAACGPSIPAHTGYPADAKAPWSKPRRIILNERNEATVDGKLDYPKRKRAEWLLVSLDQPGQLKVVFTQDTTSPRAEAEVEILDEGFNVVAEGTEDDEGEDKKIRAAKLPAGKAYVHVYTKGKTDTLDYEMKVTFAGEGAAQADTGFPANVPNPPILAAVPPVDDAPTRKKPKDDKPRDKPKDDKPKEVAVAGSVRGRIAEYGEEGGKVKITIDKGQDNGVEEGWRGYIVNKATKKKLSGSDFTVKTVRSSECEASVDKSVDEVVANRSVVLSKP